MRWADAQSPPSHGAGALEAELAGVALAVLAAALEHVAHVVARLLERDVAAGVELAGSTGATDPAAHVGLASVIGGHREHLVAVVAAQQVAQVIAAIGDVDLRSGQITLHERA